MLASSHTDDMSEILYSTSPGMKRMPFSAGLSSTTPLTGERSVRVRL